MKKLKKVVGLIKKTAKRQRNKMRIARENRLEREIARQRVIIGSLKNKIEAMETDLKPLVHNLKVISNKYKFGDILN